MGSALRRDPMTSANVHVWKSTFSKLGRQCLPSWLIANMNMCTSAYNIESQLGAHPILIDSYCMYWFITFKGNMMSLCFINMLVFQVTRVHMNTAIVSSGGDQNPRLCVRAVVCAHLCAIGCMCARLRSGARVSARAAVSTRRQRCVHSNLIVAYTPLACISRRIW